MRRLYIVREPGGLMTPFTSKASTRQLLKDIQRWGTLKGVTVKTYQVSQQLSPRTILGSNATATS